MWPSPAHPKSCPLGRFTPVAITQGFAPRPAKSESDGTRFGRSERLRAEKKAQSCAT